MSATLDGNIFRFD